MPADTVPAVTLRLPSPALRRFAWGVLIYFIAVILWGTLVRATGSGAGCGNHWPLCNGTVMQHSASVNTMIEFVHRLTSGLSFFSVVALLAWTWAGTVRGHQARAAAVASVVFTLIEATLGALLVKLGLTAQSQSPLRPAYLALHLTNTLLLVGRAYSHRALAQPQQGLSARQHPPCCSLRHCCRHPGCHDRGRYRIAGCAGRYALPSLFAGTGAGPGLLLSRWLAGALALDASYGCIRIQHSAHLAAHSRGQARKLLGQSRAFRSGSIAIGKCLYAGTARRDSASPAMDSGRALACRRCAMGRAGRTHRPAYAATEGSGLASQQVSESAKRPCRSGAFPVPCSLFPVPCSLFPVFLSPQESDDAGSPNPGTAPPHARLWKLR